MPRAGWGGCVGDPKPAMGALPALLPKVLQKGGCEEGPCRRLNPGLATEVWHVPEPGHPAQLEGLHPSPLSSLRRLLAPGYTETHYTADGQPVTVTPNHTVGAGGGTRDVAHHHFFRGVLALGLKPKPHRDEARCFRWQHPRRLSREECSNTWLLYLLAAVQHLRK